MTGGAQPIEVKYVIFCDDIRIEINGKSIFIGVYTGDIAAPIFPGFLDLSFWLDVHSTAVGKHLLKVKVMTTPNEVNAFQFTTEVNVPSDNARTSLAFGGVVLKFEQPGAIKVMYSVDEGPWIEIANKRVVRAEMSEQS